MERKKTAYILSFFLIVTGILITLENFHLIRNVSHHWPFMLLIMGLGFITLFLNRNKSDIVLLWLGTFQFFLGIFFYYLNATSWKELISLWPVFLGIIGLSFLSVVVFTGRMLYVYFASAFIALFIIFTLVFSISPKLWPLSFVVFGISLLIIDYLQRKMQH